MIDHNMGYQIFYRRVILKTTLTLVSGLHIGAGREIGATASDLPVLKDINDNPFIPGSSLKGVLRSNVEAFLRGFARADLVCCQIGGDEEADDPALRPCIGRNRKEELRKAANSDARIWEESCWVCRFFGSPWIASKVQFIDLPVVTAWAPQLLAVRDGVVIDRESETAAKGKKFDFEVVPPGTKFGAEILIENPEDYELGMLMLSFDFINDGLALLGGNTSRGLGRMRIDLDEIAEFTPDSILANLRSEEAPTSDIPQPSEEASPSEESSPGPGDEAQQEMRACLKLSGILDHDGLVSAMQERDWAKPRLKELGYDNWKMLFETSVRAGIISQTGEEFHLPGEKPEQPIADEFEAPLSQEEEEKALKREEAREKAKIWKDALYRKLKETLEGGKEGCSKPSTIKPESSIGSNQ